MAIYFTAKIDKRTAELAGFLFFWQIFYQLLEENMTSFTYEKKMQIRPSAPGLLLTVTKEHVSLVEYDQGVAQEYLFLFALIRV